MSEPVEFYRANEKPYGVFSNLFKRQFRFECVDYPTAEHAYQAGKPRKDNVRDWLMAAPSPSLLAMAAHGLYHWDIAPGWSKNKVDRMRKVLYAKFQQHGDLRATLLLTGQRTIIECGKTDNAVNRFWGEVNGKGKNVLGILLMEYRCQLQQQIEKGKS